MEPPLGNRLELAIGVLSSLTANIHRDPKRRPEPFAAKDFIMDWEKLLAADLDKEKPKQEEYMSAEQILVSFDKLIEKQNRWRPGGA
jgi:hypothetical protein